MKKSLSLLLALAMVFGMFASVAAAADNTLTTAQKYQWFVDNKILKGDTSGNPRLDDKLTRAEFATIAVSVAGLTPVTTGSHFADVNSSQWWYGAIEAAAKAGLVNGVGAGQFAPKANVTVEQIIKVAVLMAGLQPAADGTTVDGSDAWAGPYVKAAIDAGLVAAGGDYKAEATRGQTIDIAFAVVQYKAVPTLSDVTAVANADDTITVSGKVVGKADSVKVALGTADAVAATLKDDGTFTYTTAKQATGTYNITVVAYDGAKASAKVEKSVTIAGFAVASATVLNGKQIAVKFNKAAKEGSVAANEGASVVDNYELRVTDGANAVTRPVNASLSDDKQTVTLTFANAFANNTYQQLRVFDVKSATGQTVSEYKAAIYLSDTTAASVSKVTYTGTAAKVEFSEPVVGDSTNGFGAAVSVDGVQIGTDNTVSPYYAVTDFTTDGTGTLATAITIYGLDGGSSHDLDIVDLTDSIGNSTDISYKLNVPDDTVAPTIVSVKAENGDLRIKFSEPIQASTTNFDTDGDGTGDFWGAFKVHSNNALLGDLFVNGTTDSNNEIVVNLQDWWAAIGVNYISTTITVSDYYDYVLNKGAKFTQAVSLTADHAAPKAVSGFVTGDHIVLKLDEAIKAGDGTVAPTTGITPAQAVTDNVLNLASINIKHTDTNGVRNAGDFSSLVAVVGYDINNNDTIDSDELNYLDIQVTNNDAFAILDGDKLKDGNYTVTLPVNSVVDNHTNSNTTAGIGFTFKVSGNTASTSGTITLAGVTQDPTNPSRLTLELSNSAQSNGTPKDIAASALNASKILINGKAVPSASDIYFAADRFHIVVDLPTDAIPVNGIRTVSIKDIVDVDGNSVITSEVDGLQDDTHDGSDSAHSRNANNYAVTLVENVKPKLLSANVVTDTSLVLNFSENIHEDGSGNAITTDIADVGGIEVYINNVKIDLTNALYVVSGKTVTIFLASNTFAATQTVSVKLISSNLADVHNNAVNDASVTAKHGQ